MVKWYNWLDQIKTLSEWVKICRMGNKPWWADIMKGVQQISKFVFVCPWIDKINIWIYQLQFHKYHNITKLRERFPVSFGWDNFLPTWLSGLVNLWSFLSLKKKMYWKGVLLTRTLLFTKPGVTRTVLPIWNILVNGR